ncbi:hypothetical protein C5167_001111, partial [Papaver somniferum]
MLTHKKENNKSRFTAKCADEKCGWKFHAASIDERNEMFQIRRKIMCLMAERREIGANMMTPLTPEYEEKLVALQDEGLAWEVLVASPTVFEVISERSHMVDLEHETCTCQR